jgi:hypothetical protein
MSRLNVGASSAAKPRPAVAMMPSTAMAADEMVRECPILVDGAWRTVFSKTSGMPGRKSAKRAAKWQVTNSGYKLPAIILRIAEAGKKPRRGVDILACLCAGAGLADKNVCPAVSSIPRLICDR